MFTSDESLRREAPAPEGVAGYVPATGPIQSGDVLRYEVDEETNVGKVTAHLRPDAGGGMREAIEDLRIQSEMAYCRYIEQMSKPECLGFEAKLLSGKFSKAELDAHSRAGELLGKHQALSDAVKYLEAAISTPPAGGGVRVKPLEWREYEREGDIDEWEAETAFGTFYAVKRRAFCFMPSYDGSHIQYKGQQSPEEAKAVCQADYESRILSALSTPPAAVESNASVEARLREALREKCELVDDISPSEEIGVFDGSGQWIVLCTVDDLRALSSVGDGHDSDCAAHNEPAHPNGPCDYSAAVGDEAKKSEGGPLNWQLSDDAKARIAEIDTNRRNAAINASNIVAGSPSSSSADRREIVARALMEKWPGDYAWGDETREPNELAFETADAILAALDGGACA